MNKTDFQAKTLAGITVKRLIKHNPVVMDFSFTKVLMSELMICVMMLLVSDKIVCCIKHAIKQDILALWSNLSCNRLEG